MQSSEFIVGLMKSKKSNKSRGNTWYCCSDAQSHRPNYVFNKGKS